MSRRRQITALVVGFFAIAFGVLADGLGDAGSATAALSALPAQLSIGPGGQSIPRSFFGLSTEYSELPNYEALGPVFRHVLSLVRPENKSAMMLRIGGRSADGTFYVTKPTKPVPYGAPIGQPWLRSLAAVSRADHLSVVLDMNLAVHSPTMAATFAQAAKKDLGSAFYGVEIGNEPDLYNREPFLDKERIASTLSSTPRVWTTNYSPADYRRDYSAYARALVAAVPGIRIGGPEIISAKPQWLAAIEGLGREDPSFLTVHRYVGSTCFSRASPFYPTLATLLDPLGSIGFGATIDAAAAFARAHAQPLSIDEINSISCGGNPGVANSFATALWAPDALFELIRNGAASVSWHIRPKAVNAPFHLTAHGIVAMPELYGLAVFAQMTSPGAEIADSSLHAAAGLNLRAWVVREGGKLEVLLLNKGPRAANVALRLGNRGKAFIKRLTAPGAGATAGVRFAGQRIGTDGTWRGREVQTIIQGSAGIYGVSVPGFSAALVTAG